MFVTEFNLPFLAGRCLLQCGGISKHTIDLSIQSSQVSHCCGKQKIPFQSLALTHWIGRSTRLGKWRRTGPYEVLVSEESAIQAGARVPQDIFLINRDYSGIVKLVNGDASYLDITQFLHETIAKRTGGLWPLKPAVAPAGLLRFVKGLFSQG